MTGLRHENRHDFYGHSLELQASWHQEAAWPQSGPWNYTSFLSERPPQDPACVTTEQWPTTIPIQLSTYLDAAVRKQQSNTHVDQISSSPDEASSLLDYQVPSFASSTVTRAPRQEGRLKKIKKERIKKYKRGAAQHWRTVKYLVTSTATLIISPTWRYILNNRKGKQALNSAWDSDWPQSWKLWVLLVTRKFLWNRIFYLRELLLFEILCDCRIKVFSIAFVETVDISLLFDFHIPVHQNEFSNCLTTRKKNNLSTLIGHLFTNQGKNQPYTQFRKNLIPLPLSLVIQYLWKSGICSLDAKCSIYPQKIDRSMNPGVMQASSCYHSQLSITSLCQKMLLPVNLFSFPLFC